MADALQSTLRPARAVFYSLLIFGYGLIANALFLCTALIVPLSASWAYELNSAIASALWSFMQTIFEDFHCARIDYVGARDIPDSESAFIISNHISYSDFYMIQGLAKRKKMLGYCRYFAKFALIYTTPIFGISFWLIGMVMVRRNWTTDRRETEKAFDAIKKNKRPIWLVSYSEGTRMLPGKLQQSQAFARQKDLPVLKHVLLPRTRGFVASMSQLRNSHVKAVYDFTIACVDPQGRFQSAANLYETHAYSRISPSWRYQVKIDRYLIKGLPQDDEELSKWLIQRFKSKDDYLEKVRQAWIDKGIVKA